MLGGQSLASYLFFTTLYYKFINSAYHIHVLTHVRSDIYNCELGTYPLFLLCDCFYSRKSDVPDLELVVENVPFIKEANSA